MTSHKCAYSMLVSPAPYFFLGSVSRGRKRFQSPSALAFSCHRKKKKSGIHIGWLSYYLGPWKIMSKSKLPGWIQLHRYVGGEQEESGDSPFLTGGNQFTSSVPQMPHLPHPLTVSIITVITMQHKTRPITQRMKGRSVSLQGTGQDIWQQPQLLC